MNLLRWFLPTPSTLELLYEAQDAHILSLKAQITAQQEMIRVLSDDKYFRPVVHVDAPPPVENHTPFTMGDYQYQADEPVIIPEKEEAIDFTAELDELEVEYNKVRAQQGKGK